MGAPARASLVLIMVAVVLFAIVPEARQNAGSAPRPLPTPSTAAKKPWTVARTSWGDPDFAGVWNYATMTPFERPRDMNSKDVLTPEEAAAFEQDTITRRATANQTAGPDWWDPGTAVMKNRRTSLVVDPPDGRVPSLTPEAQKRMAARGRGQRNNPEAPEDLALNERCLLRAAP